MHAIQLGNANITPSNILICASCTILCKALPLAYLASRVSSCTSTIKCCHWPPASTIPMTLPTKEGIWIGWISMWSRLLKISFTVPFIYLFTKMILHYGNWTRVWNVEPCCPKLIIFTVPTWDPHQHVARRSAKLRSWSPTKLQSRSAAELQSRFN